MDCAREILRSHDVRIYCFLKGPRKGFSGHCEVNTFLRRVNMCSPTREGAIAIDDHTAINNYQSDEVSCSLTLTTPHTCALRRRMFGRHECYP